MKRVAVILAAALPLGACSWGIKLDSGGEKVRTAWTGDLGSRCKDLGKITVSVLDHVGPVNRRDLKVRDELEVMARNEAARMNADTVQPIGDPQDGEQSWRAFHCGPASRDGKPPAMRIEQHGKDGAVETFPIDH
ncbi:DUF4156 domain-containing protein [Dokdonella sp.]|uniref:DUF4156 domain-containing protein n=1 Tax=Dokdonella sp. TaxID=2291710 RepID=UPI002635E385|nr:DUF4156 domain-containing protein [Dokdonella sp.]